MDKVPTSRMVSLVGEGERSCLAKMHQWLYLSYLEYMIYNIENMNDFDLIFPFNSVYFIRKIGFVGKNRNVCFGFFCQNRTIMLT